MFTLGEFSFRMWLFERLFGISPQKSSYAACPFFKGQIQDSGASQCTATLCFKTRGRRRTFGRFGDLKKGTETVETEMALKLAFKQRFTRPAARWWQLKHFLVSPRTLGKWSQLTSIFQMGWNHQLASSFEEWFDLFLMIHVQHIYIYIYIPAKPKE